MKFWFYFNVAFSFVVIQAGGEELYYLTYHFAKAFHLWPDLPIHLPVHFQHVHYGL
jgi:hypothetical protein